MYLTKMVELVLICIASLGIVYLVWYLSFGVGDHFPETAKVELLTNDVDIYWGQRDDAQIHAHTFADAIIALGYVHGFRKAWPIMLWRQVALSRATEWLGPSVLPVDRMLLRLELAERARESFVELSAENQTLLSSYTAGLNAALQDNNVRFGQEFVLLDIEPEPWEAWHTLALERLFAWLMAVPPVSAAHANEDIIAFFDADTHLRKLLHLHGFDNSIAWIAGDGTTKTLFQRHVFGDTALPLYQEIILHIGGKDSLHAASLPGTPFFPGGQSRHGGWALLPHSTTQLRQVLWDAASITATHQRATNLDISESETILTDTYMEENLLFSSSGDTDPDSAWVLQWSGMAKGSDLDAWQALPEGKYSPFTLLSGYGLRTDSAHQWTVLGNPPVQQQLPKGMFVGISPWATHVANFLARKDTLDVEGWLDDTYSPWAATTAPSLIQLAQGAEDVSNAYKSAITYLNNWDFRYISSSTAASVFDTWMLAYARALDMPVPYTPVADSTVNIPLLRSSLQTAVDTLTMRLGPDESQWRWERVYPDRHHFPVLSESHLVVNPRFATFEWPGDGHASLLAWNPSLSLSPLPATATWEAWVQIPFSGTMTVRRHQLDPYEPMGRYTTIQPEEVTTQYPSPITATTTLTPSRN